MLVSENNKLKETVHTKSIEIDDLKNQLTMKGTMDQKLQERDINNVHKKVNHPEQVSKTDAKMIALMNTYEK